MFSESAVYAGKDFMNAPWLFAEAYKYRRLHECFSVSKFWKDYDVFYRQKVLESDIHLSLSLLINEPSAIPFPVQPMLFSNCPCVSLNHSK